MTTEKEDDCSDFFQAGKLYHSDFSFKLIPDNEIYFIEKETGITLVFSEDYNNSTYFNEEIFVVLDVIKFNNYKCNSCYPKDNYPGDNLFDKNIEFVKGDNDGCFSPGLAMKILTDKMLIGWYCIFDPMDKGKMIEEVYTRLY